MFSLVVDEGIKNYIFKHIIYRINFFLCLPFAFCFSHALTSFAAVELSLLNHDVRISR